MYDIREEESPGLPPHIGLAQLKNGCLTRTAAATRSALADYYRTLSDLPGLEFLA